MSVSASFQSVRNLVGGEHPAVLVPIAYRFLRTSGENLSKLS